MKALPLHDWDLSVAEARDVQLSLRERMVRTDQLPKVTRIAGADVALRLGGPRGWERGEGQAIELTRAVSDGYRVPRPTRGADHYVRELRRNSE